MVETKVVTVKRPLEDIEDVAVLLDILLAIHNDEGDRPDQDGQKDPTQEKLPPDLRHQSDMHPGVELDVLFLANARVLTDGDLAGLLGSYVWAFVGSGLNAASLAVTA